MHVHSHVSPYDLIKKYVGESSPPNSLSDSHLSSDGGDGGKEGVGDGAGFGSESEEFTDSDDDVAAVTASSGLKDRRVAARFNSFRISGQKIQIYSDCSAENGAIGHYSLSSSSSDRDGDEEDNDADADDDDDDDEAGFEEDRDSCYDADVSLQESPCIRKLPPPPPPPLVMDVVPPPCKPPRRKSSEKELRPSRNAATSEAVPKLQLQIVDLDEPAASAARLISNGINCGGAEHPRRTATLPRLASRPVGGSDKIHVSRQTSAESHRGGGGSVTSRSRSFAGGSGSSRESLLFGISQNFSTEIMKELYGSKTSLLQHLDQEHRRKRLSDPAAGSSRAAPVAATVAGEEATGSPAVRPDQEEADGIGNRGVVNLVW